MFASASAISGSSAGVSAETVWGSSQKTSAAKSRAAPRPFLDVFEKIGAVQYDEKFGEQLEKFVEERIAFAKKNKIRLDEGKIREIRGYAQFAGNEMNEKGIAPKLDCAKIAACFEKLGDMLAFLHITEYEQELDGNGKAAKLINELFDAAAQGLASAANRPEKENEEDDE